MLRLFLVFVCVEIVQCLGYGNNMYGSSYDTNHGSYNFENNKYCVDLSPYYGELDLNQVAGVWYAVEKIPHDNTRDYRIENTPECFYIDIKEVDMQPTPPTPYPYMQTINPIQELYPNRYADLNRIRHFVLEMHRGIIKEDYHLRVNTSRKGFWQTSLPNFSVDQPYRNFGGVIQVLKVANNHLVLNFCIRLPYSQLYSLVLARAPNQLYPEELANIHTVFSLKKLSTSGLQRACNSSTQFVISHFVLLFTAFIMSK